MNTQRKPRLQNFATWNDFVGAVVHHGENRGLVRDTRLFRADSLGANEKWPSDGGFLVPQEKAEWLSDRIVTESVLLSRADRFPMSRPKLVLPAVDETSRADGSRLGGVRLYWKDESTTATATKPKFRGMELNAKKLIGFCFVTDELLGDVPALAAWLERAFVSEGIFVVEDAILNGSGTDRPLGILTAGNAALITVMPPSGIAPQTLTPDCLLSMQGRLHPECHATAIWLMGLDAYNQISGQSFSNGAPVITYQGNRRFILGNELFLSEQTSALGNAGDVLLCDPKKYIIGVRSQEFISSVHLQWLTDECCFRFVLRIDGQSGVKSPLIPRNGSIETSPFITLAAR